jgi:hypothetical protein
MQRQQLTEVNLRCFSCISLARSLDLPLPPFIYIYIYIYIYIPHSLTHWQLARSIHLPHPPSLTSCVLKYDGAGQDCQYTAF